MILGLGNDIIEIERIKEAFFHHRERFLSRLFTEKERAYCQRFHDPFPHFSGRYAAKEAIVKALGSGFGPHIGWQDIEILADPSGRPLVYFSRNVSSLFHSPNVIVSISHCKNYATAVAIWMK